ncbi:MAG: hypothetical protein ACI87H_003587, partial [Gammaproteobacteria bacterium]
GRENRQPRPDSTKQSTPVKIADRKIAAEILLSFSC